MFGTSITILKWRYSYLDADKVATYSLHSLFLLWSHVYFYDKLCSIYLSEGGFFIEYGKH